MKRVLAIIPARGGSKGIVRKNLVKINGIPLIAYTIQLGKKLVRMGAVSRVIVSTDDQEIAEKSKELGAEVPFIRPKKLATDHAKSAAVLVHAINWALKKSEKYDAILLLQPTSPLRKASPLARAIKMFLRQKKSKSLISCYKKTDLNIFSMYSSTMSGSLKPLNRLHNAGIPRQKNKPIWIRNGAAYLTRTDFLKKQKKIICDRPLLFKMKKKDSIDINSYADLGEFRKLMKKNPNLLKR